MTTATVLALLLAAVLPVLVLSLWGEVEQARTIRHLQAQLRRERAEAIRARAMSAAGPAGFAESVLADLDQLDGGAL